jgi:hypothetical protein
MITHANDAVGHFGLDLLVRAPDWLARPRSWRPPSRGPARSTTQGPSTLTRTSPSPTRKTMASLPGFPSRCTTPLGMRTKSPGPPSTLSVPRDRTPVAGGPASGTRRCRGPGGRASRTMRRLRFGTGQPRRGCRRRPRGGPPRASRQRGGETHPVRSGWVGPWCPAFRSGMPSRLGRQANGSKIQEFSMKDAAMVSQEGVHRAVGDQMAAQHRSTHLVVTQRGWGGPGRRGQPCLLVMGGRFRPPGVHGYDRLQPLAVHSCWPGGHGNHPVRVMCAWSPGCSLALRSRCPQRGLECSTGPLPDLKRLDLPAVAVRRRP